VSSELKPIPCRFCDGPARPGALLPQFRILRMVQTPEEYPERRYWSCPKCTMPMTLAAWNRRAPSPAVKALVEAFGPLLDLIPRDGPKPEAVRKAQAALAAVEREIGAQS
jgi:hypothetical protein